jgi:hypothetical protein
MTLTEEQTGVAKGMAVALFITIATLGCAVKLLGPKFIVISLVGRYALCALSILAPALTLAFSIGRLAKHRFFNAQDIGGSALTQGTGTAILLQSLLQNTLEQAVLALFAYASWSALAPSYMLPLGPTAAALFLLGRILFFAGYAQGPRARALGFALTFYPTLLLLLGSTYFAISEMMVIVRLA